MYTSGASSLAHLLGNVVAGRRRASLKSNFVTTLILRQTFSVETLLGFGILASAQ